MGKYVLVTVCERAITWDIFASYEDARNCMVENLKQEFDRANNGWCNKEYKTPSWDEVLNEYEDSSELDHKKHVEYDDMALCYDSAWSNLDYDYNIDWQIIEVSDV